MSGLAINWTNVPALPSPRTVGAHWWAATTRFFTASAAAHADTGASQPRRNRIPRRYDYLEHAAMSRAMDRL
jgi:hypothetical protein